LPYSHGTHTANVREFGTDGPQANAQHCAKPRADGVEDHGMGAALNATTKDLPVGRCLSDNDAL